MCACGLLPLMVVFADISAILDARAYPAMPMLLLLLLLLLFRPHPRHVTSSVSARQALFPSCLLSFHSPTVFRLFSVSVSLSLAHFVYY